eukprot:TRINITY_DN537_c0_g1_i1.p1 TRINITY_DN537_c0_g1~~TRINITY_DN537_c0_g1_i1.p1  ORF type:complete len:228 (-),score=49.76 TRINITY_DN537_c0_g1_i1:27-710(-)
MLALQALAARAKIPCKIDGVLGIVATLPDDYEFEGALSMPPGVAVIMMTFVAQNDLPTVTHPELERLRIVGLTHPIWASLVKQEGIWRMLSIRRWPNINPYINVSDWYGFYSIRHRNLRKGIEPGEPDPPTIENCFRTDEQGNPEWEFLCPVTVELLRRTSNRLEDYCTVCKSTVHLVKTVAELEHTAAGNCVSIAPGVISRRIRQSMVKGKRKAPPRPRPAPGEAR